MTVKSATNQQFRLKTRPSGRIQKDNFDQVTEPVRSPGEGEFLIKTVLLSLDPTNRIWMSDVPQYMPPVKIGEVMRGLGIGQVVESKNSAFPVGHLVSGPVGWQEYSIANGTEAWPFVSMPKGLPVPPEVLAGAAGMTGLTAYFGVFEVAKAKPGQTMVVSAAAGAVGSIVGQLGKIAGCRVIGIAGTDEKCDWLTKELGFDAAVNYKSADWKAKLEAATPAGIDINFENVGGEIMEYVVSRMNLHGVMALCGMIAGYNDNDDSKTRLSLSPVLMKRIRIEGFIVSDFFAKFPEATTRLVGWLAEGKLKSRETIVEGLENAPTAINQLFDGGNTGKLLVRVAKPE